MSSVIQRWLACGLVIALDVAAFPGYHNVRGDTVTAEATLSEARAPELLPGDFDLDADVDGGDLEYWEGGFGKSSGATITDGDANDDKKVDGFDFLIWQRQFGEGLGPLTALTLISLPVPDDFDEDGDVDGLAFLKWQHGQSPTPLSASDLATREAEFGSVQSLIASVTVAPEPSSLALVVACLVASLLRRRQRVRLGVVSCH